METTNQNPDQNKNGGNNPVKKNEGNNPKLPNNDPDQTPEKETQAPPVANPNKGNQQNDPNKTKIGFNK